MAFLPHHISDKVQTMPETIFVNPVVAALDDEQFTMHESCLSIPNKM